MHMLMKNKLYFVFMSENFIAKDKTSNIDIFHEKKMCFICSPV